MSEGTLGGGGARTDTPLSVRIVRQARKFNWKRVLFIGVGIALFCALFFAPALPDAVDPAGKHFALSRNAQATLALFLLACTWWVFEVVPIGITAIAIGVVQALLRIRDPRAAFSDYMDPSVWFIFGSLVMGMTFSRTGLTRRMAYGMLLVVGERTRMIYLGCFAITGCLTLIMAHTAAAATVYPILLTIHTLYSDDDKPTRFGKGLFIGMAFVAGAGSIVSMLGSARAAVAVGFFKSIAGKEVGFFQLPVYMITLGGGVILLLWLFISLFFKPERPVIGGLRDRVRTLYQKLGPMTAGEKLTLAVVGATLGALCLGAFVPFFQALNKSAVLLVSTLLFFLFGILSTKDLEDVPWNIILLFGGSMSLGLALWETGAAAWLAIQWLVLFKSAHWFVFTMGIALFVMSITNLIMNVTAIAITLPVALVMAPYLGVAPEVIFFTALTTAGTPFLLLIGAAPNAMAYESRQFKAGEFLRAGLPASLIVLAVLALHILVVWPLMGMPIRMR